MQQEIPEKRVDITTSIKRVLSKQKDQRRNAEPLDSNFSAGIKEIFYVSKKYVFVTDYKIKKNAKAIKQFTYHRVLYKVDNNKYQEENNIGRRKVAIIEYKVTKKRVQLFKDCMF